jgi:hypothetical protein
MSRAVRNGAGYFGVIAVIAGISLECPLFGLVGWPLIALLAIFFIFCIASVLGIPLAYILYSID